jgi:hypothetical protein
MAEVLFDSWIGGSVPILDASPVPVLGANIINCIPSFSLVLMTSRSLLPDRALPIQSTPELWKS